jgi:hypothetical protein
VVVVDVDVVVDVVVVVVVEVVVDVVVVGGSVVVVVVVVDDVVTNSTPSTSRSSSPNGAPLPSAGSELATPALPEPESPADWPALSVSTMSEATDAPGPDPSAVLIGAVSGPLA